MSAREIAARILAAIAEARECDAEAGWYGFVSFADVEDLATLVVEADAKAAGA